MDWPKHIEIRSPLPECVTLVVRHVPSASGTWFQWTVQVPEFNLEITDGNTPEAAVAQAVRMLDMIYGGEAPIPEGIRAMIGAEALKE